MKASTNKEKGKAGLAIAIGYYGSNGYTVSVPLNDTQDYDLIVDKGDKLQKVQVKCTGCLDEYGRYAVSLRSCGGTNGAVYQYLQDTNVDVVFVVCTNGWMFEIPKKDITSRSTLHVYGIENSVNDTYKYLVQYCMNDPEVTIIRPKRPRVLKKPISRKIQEKSKNYCIECGKQISKRATRCVECNQKYLKSLTSWTEETRDGRPSKDELSKLLMEDTSFREIGRMYGVTDNSVRKWCKKYGLPFRRNDIKSLEASS